MTERRKSDYVREGEIHASNHVLWVNSDHCEVRINNIEQLDGMNPVKVLITQNGGLPDIILEKV